MKKQFFLIMTILISSLMHSQDSLSHKNEKAKVFGVSPSKKTKNVNGVLLKYYDEIDNEIKPKKVNGLGLGFNGLGVFFPVLLLVNIGSIDSWEINNSDFEDLPKKMNTINGMQLSIINMEPTVTNGFELSLSSNISAPSVINGVSVSPLYNFHHTTNGVTVSTFANVSKKCRGLQVALINVCKDSKGLQIGFWNENEKRKLPLINWNFKSKKEKL
ncbi:LA_2272 family surface repeat-containing protein [Chryseobacterium scophthalmum]|uniref:Uncharacterized protein n=1 Tax=Chryseobacterium scophthalmum TaxID=59733 RepID=A0A1N6J749_9FLAO|nr:hypothetical protein [Chryseobacterium scophthalmum]SIO40062.1 hypothetical protein SAMN05421769_4157 [Chryseobacterium scophthalmum]